MMKIEVSPFPLAALPRVWQWTEPFRDRVSDDFGPQTLDQFVDGMLASPLRMWAVYGDGELGGMITFQRLSPWAGTAHCVFKPGFQRKGIAPEACRIAIHEMFAEGIGKLVFYPLAGNLGIGSLLVNLGAKREGLLRAQTLVGGKPADMNVYGLLKGEFENAIRSSSADHRVGGRGRPGDPGRGAQREAEDVHQHDDAVVEPGHAGLAEPDHGVLEGPDHGPGSGHGADQEQPAAESK